MKNLIFLFLSFFSIAGQAQIYKFRAVQFNCTRYQNQPMEPPETKDLKDMPVEFDMDSSILYIHSPNIQGIFGRQFVRAFRPRSFWPIGRAR